MQLAYFADEISKEDFDEAVRRGVEAGADGVELRNGIWGKLIQDINDDDVKRVQDVLAKYGSRVICVASPVGKCAHDSVEEMAAHQRMFDRMIVLARAFDTDLIRGFALWNPLRESGDRARPDIREYMDIILDFLEPIARTARREGVTFALENEGDTLAGTCEETRLVMDAVEERIGTGAGMSFCWDVDNGIHCGESHHPTGYERLKGRVSHVHAKPNDFLDLDPIKGSSMVYADLLRLLLADGYPGACSIEHWGSPEEMLKGIRLLRKTLDGL